MTRHAAIFGVMVTVALSASRAQGADPTQVQEANSLFQEGASLMDKGDCEHARVKFLAVVALVKSSTALWNLGYCEVRSGHHVEGARHLRQYLHNPAADPKNVKFANEDLLPAALAAVGQLRIDAPDGVDVVLDGKDDAGVAPFAEPVAVAPGSHHATARLGEQTMEQDVEVRSGEVAVVRLVPGARAGAGASAGSEAASAPSAVGDEGPGGEARGRGLTAGRKIALGLGVAAVVTEAVGIGFGVVAQNHDANAATDRGGASACYQSSSAACGTLRDESSAARTDATVANVLYASGAVLAVAAIGTWIFTPPRALRTGLRLTPVVGPAAAEIRLSSSF